MLISEQKEFDKELNELCHKYRIQLMSGIYISAHGAGEQYGAFGLIQSGVGKPWSEIDAAFLASELGNHMWVILDKEGIALFPQGDPDTSDGDTPPGL